MKQIVKLGTSPSTMGGISSTLPAISIRNHFKYPIRAVVRENHLAAMRARTLHAREHAAQEQFDRIADRFLHRSLSRAAATIPAYRPFAERIPTSSLKRFIQDNFPVIDKNVLLTRRSEYYPRNGVALPWWSVGKTSGTSGTPLDVFRDLGSTIWEHAFHLQHWNWAGTHPGDRQVVLRGDMVVPPDRETPPFWHHDIPGRQLIVSTRHLSPRHIHAIVDAIDGFGASQLRAYPSAAFELARLVEEHQLNVGFRSIITGSEILYPLQREVIERVFGGRVFDFYGMAERVAFGIECEHGRMHIHPEYSFVEITDAEGRPTSGEGFIVGTTYLNMAMPLIRYRLDDTARWNPSPCPCGRTYPSVDKIVGRIGDLVFDLDGKPISPGIITFAFKGISNIVRSQVAQVSRTEWEVRIVPGHDYSEEDGRHLLKNFDALVSTRLNVKLKLVSAIPNLPSGKYKWVSQECGETRRR